MKVSVEAPLPVTEAGLNFAVTRFGNPEILKPTVPVKPLIPVIVIVSEPLEFLLTVMLPGAEMEKSGVGARVTTRVTVTVWLRTPSLPVITRG